jgi:hypothetical protein
MFIRNFQGTCGHPSVAETLKIIRQKHDESLRDYVKLFYDARNATPYIHDIEIINAFYDVVNDIKPMEEIAMNKPKTVADLFAVADACIESSEAQARLLESQGKGTSRKNEDREVNIADRSDRKDQGDRRYHRKQSSEQKEKRHFQCLDDAEKWCEIHRTSEQKEKSARLFWIGRRCQHQWRRCHRSPGESISAGWILMAMSRWQRSTSSSGVACPSPPRRRGRSSSLRSA